MHDDEYENDGFIDRLTDFFNEGASKNRRFAESLRNPPERKPVSEIKRDGSNPNENCLPVFTWGDILDAWYETGKQIPEIKGSTVIIENISRMNTKACYRIEQIYTDTDGKPVFADAGRKHAYGRIVFTESLDNRLKDYMGNKNEIHLQV